MQMTKRQKKHRKLPKALPNALSRVAEILCFTALLTLIFLSPQQVWASGSTAVFDDINNKICEFYSTARVIVLGFGGFSGIVLGVMAMFGTVQWSKMFTLSAGLFVVMTADLIVRYLINDINLASCIKAPASADLTDPLFAQVNLFLDVSFAKVRLIVYGISGIAAISLGTAAMFGQFAWRKFFGIIAGIGIIALIDSWISWLVGYSRVFTDAS